MLGENGKLYDSKKGEALPDGVSPMPVLQEADLAKFPEPTTADVVPNFVARYWDMVALADKEPARVIGDGAMLQDMPGFNVDFITRSSAGEAKFDAATVLMPMRGHWRVQWDGGSTTLAPGDTMSVPEGMAHKVEPSMTGEASLYRIVGTGDNAGLTQGFTGGHS